MHRIGCYFFGDYIAKLTGGHREASMAPGSRCSLMLTLFSGPEPFVFARLEVRLWMRL